ncbi:hypothetical protein C0992_001280, partial [Termitomyces sp. T32_za158]
MLGHSPSASNDESDLHLYDDDPPVCTALEDLSFDDALSQAVEECLRGDPDPSQPTKSKSNDKKAYVVFYGRSTGVFLTWAATAWQVYNFQNALWKGYYSVEDVIKAWKHALANNLVGPLPDHGWDTPLASPSPSAQYKPQHQRCTSSNIDGLLASFASMRVLSNKECWWSVVCGDHPGVYQG